MSHWHDENELGWEPGGDADPTPSFGGFALNLVGISMESRMHTTSYLLSGGGGGGGGLRERSGLGVKPLVSTPSLFGGGGGGGGIGCLAMSSS